MNPSRWMLLISPLFAVVCPWCSAEDAIVVRQVVRAEAAGANLLVDDAWRPWQAGFETQDGVFLCDNGNDTRVQRGASQSVTLDQQRAEPIVASAWSRSADVSGAPDSNYSVYLDLVYQDGSQLWGQVAPFATGTHDWQRRQVVVFPDRPVRQVSMHLLLRGHSGKAWFRQPELRQMETPRDATRFDGTPVVLTGDPAPGFTLRDVAANSDYVRADGQSLGVTLSCDKQGDDICERFDVTLTDTTGRDRALTLVYSVPVSGDVVTWFADPRSEQVTQSGREYLNASRFGRVGANGRLSRYPLGCVGRGQQGTALAIDMLYPAVYRVGYNAGSGELFLAYDVALTPEKNHARVRFYRFQFDALLGFRGALDRYYKTCPGVFECRVRQQGLWMPFAKVSQVERYEDFGFRFKEGDNETDWDDAHQLLTFRYTEPMTWWMTMPADMPRTMDAARQYADQLAQQRGDRRAQALFSSGYRDPEGQLIARMLDTPWCNGAVWSMNSMPDISGSPNDFQLKWNEQLKQRLYGAGRTGGLDGEYVDSSEGYVTDELDFARAHLAASPTPLCYDATTHQPAIFRGLIAQAYVAALATDLHAMGRLTMANSTPSRLCWLAPHLDVLGTETNWNPQGKWTPMSDAELLYRRVLCKGKPFCFLMNTQFEDFSHQLVEKYMQRALAYGMFPGFFSHNASQGHYFTRPELYNRDRALFQKYVPLCRRVAEAGWEPLTGATASDPQVRVERFGQHLFTVLNDQDKPCRATVAWDGLEATECRELVGQQTLTVSGHRLTLDLAAEAVAVLDFSASAKRAGQ